MPHKQSDDPAELYALIDATLCGQVAFVGDSGEPLVMPVAVARMRHDLVWHGSTGAPWMRLLETGERIAVGLMEIDALVVGRTRFENSFWYRSAVIYGRPRCLAGEEKEEALDALTDHILPGRVAETRPSTRRELAATMVLAVPLDDWSLKVSAEWPDDPPADKATRVWAGVLPRREAIGPAVAAPDLDPTVPLPESCRLLTGESP